MVVKHVIEIFSPILITPFDTEEGCKNYVLIIFSNLNILITYILLTI